ncbi:MAG: OmpH family outer membrane protein [Bacteroidota bacterium]
MKNLLLVLNFVLTVSVGTLYYLQFFKDSPGESESLSKSKNLSDYRIVYINADSVLANYDYFEDAQAQLEEKGKKLEAEYQNRAQGLQNEVNNYQRTVSNLTIGQAKAIEEDLVKKQQNLRLYQESLTQQLLKEENEVNKELYDQVTAYLKEYSKQNNVDLVVKYNQGSDILFASDSLDITQTVIEGLNLAYANPETDTDVALDTTATK